MNVGLPGTGIGGIYYIGLAVCMPIRELFRKKSPVVQERTGGRRWGIIGLQLGFVAAIIGGMWGEVWLLNQMLLALRHAFGADFGPLNAAASEQMVFHRAKVLAFAAACASLVSLTFVFVGVHSLRFFLRRKKGKSLLNIAERQVVGWDGTK